MEEVAETTTRNAVQLFGASAHGLTAALREASSGKAKNSTRWRKDLENRSATCKTESESHATSTGQFLSNSADICPPPPGPAIAFGTTSPPETLGVRRGRWQRAA